MTQPIPEPNRRPLFAIAIAITLGSILSAIAGCFTSRPPAAPPASPPPDPVPPDTSTAAELLRMHNRHRSQESARTGRIIPGLELDPRLNSLAETHAAWMADRRTLRHGSLSQVPYNTKGENIAMGYSTEAAVMAGWMNSRGHRNNILSPRYRYAGFAQARDRDGTPYWCAIFGG